MKILLVSSSILPQKGGSSIIVENLARNFDKDELVVLGSSYFNQINDINRRETGPEFIYFFSELNLFGRGARYFDWFRKFRLSALTEFIADKILELNIDYVLGVYPNQYYSLAAARAAKKLNVPFSSYFHNTYAENRAIIDKDASTIQNEIFESSKIIFVMSRGMQDFYEEKYNMNKFVPLVHTFDNYPTQSANTGIPGDSKRTYDLVAIGNFNESNIDATARLINAIDNNSKYSLSLYTHVPNFLLEKRGLNTSSINHKGFADPDDIHQVLQAYDIGILTHGFTGAYGEIEYRTIFPTRTIPLLLSGKPIFAHSPVNSFLNSFIEHHQCAHLVDLPDEKLIIEGLDKIADDVNYQQELAQNALVAAEQFHGSTVKQQLLKNLHESIV